MSWNVSPEWALVVTSAVQAVVAVVLFYATLKLVWATRALASQAKIQTRFFAEDEARRIYFELFNREARMGFMGELLKKETEQPGDPRTKERARRARLLHEYGDRIDKDLLGFEIEPPK